MLAPAAQASPPHKSSRSSADGTPINSDRKSSLTKDFCPMRASMARNNILKLGTAIPSAMHRCSNSSSDTLAALSGSNTADHASCTVPHLLSSCSRKPSSMCCAPGSMLANVADFPSPARNFHNAFAFPLKSQPSQTKMKLPNEIEPFEVGSMTPRHAATVEPYRSFSTLRKVTNVSAPTKRSASQRCSFGVLPALATLSAVFALPSSPNFFRDTSGCETGDFGCEKKGVSPRCLFRVHIGSRSQMVISCLPGTGCKHRKRCFGLCGYASFWHASASMASSMVSVGSFPKPNFHAPSNVP
mmetsp:Transcript_104941/g.321485  ORF Transcript_104941/g.321485 Transcript_104941/m.321485 type:complete len:300 (+) Transcript_104941:1158-2057(+)